MRWEDERYVRVYTKDTVTWGALPWQSRAIWPLILRKVDRAGLLDLAGEGVEGLADLIKMPVEVVEPGVAGILKKSYAVMHGTILVVPNFIEAQETPQNDAARKRASREKARALVTKRDVESQDVTVSHETGQNVTNGHAESRAVTPSHSVPSLPVPSLLSLVPSAPAFDLKVIADRYPRRKNIGKGLDKLKAVVKTQADYDAVLVGLDRFIAEERRKGTEPDYYPHFSTWVNGRRWEDGDDLPLPSVPSESRRDSEDLGDMAKRLGLE